MARFTHIRLKILFTFFCFLAIVQAIHAQSIDYNKLSFQKLSSKDGLCNNTVVDFVEDHLGYIWMATYDGLARYDGSHFTTYLHNENDSTSLCSNRVHALEIDADNRVWVGTTAGLNLYDYKTNRFYQFVSDKENAHSLIHNTISYLYYDSIHNFLWISSDENGLSRLDLSSFDITQGTKQVEFTRYPFLVKEGITDFGLDEQSRLILFSRSDSIKLYNAKNDSFTHFSYPEVSGFDRKSKKAIITANGDYWVNCDDKLYLFGDHSKENEVKLSLLKTFHTSYALKQAQDEYGNLWVIGDQTYIFNPTNHSLVTKLNLSSISPKEQTTVYIDKKHQVWIGTRDDGVIKTSLQKSIFNYDYTEANSKSGKMVTSILELDEDKLLYGTYYGGIQSQTINSKGEFMHSPEKGTVEVAEKVLDVYQDKNNTIWAGTWTGGLLKLTKNRNGYSKEKVVINSSDQYGLDCFWRIKEDNDQNLWLTTQEIGVVNFNRDDHTIIKYQHDPNDSTSIKGNMVISLLIDSHNRLFAGTYLGLDMFDLEKYKSTKVPFFEHFSDYSVVNECRINHIMEDSKGQIWVSTEGKGISVLNAKLDSIKTYAQSEGLPDNVVMAAEEDSRGNIWVATQKNIARISPEGHIRTFGKGNGILDDEFKRGSVCALQNGYFCYGTINGILTFNPDLIPETSQSHYKKVILDALYIDNKPVLSGQEFNGRILLENPLFETESILLKSNENTFTFSFHTINFVNPQNTYLYKLEGYNKEWKELEDANAVTFQNLKHGNYIFKLKNASGEDEVDASLKIHIKPSLFNPYYLLILIVLILAAGIFIIRKKQNSAEVIPEQVESDREKYSTSKLNETMIADIKTRLEEHMLKQQPFLRDDLKQTEVANYLEVPLHELSQVINQELNTNFRDFINHYRVEEFKIRINKADMSVYTIMAIAEQCGFKSKSSFYRSFKKELGITPSEYLNQLK